MKHPPCTKNVQRSRVFGAVKLPGRHQDCTRADSPPRHPTRKNPVRKKGEFAAAQAALALTISLWKVMDSARSIAFRDEGRATVCYDDPALTFGWIFLRPAQQTVAPAGAYPCCKAVPAGHPGRAPLPSSVSPCHRVEPYLSQPGLRQTGCRHLAHSPRHLPRGVLPPSVSGFCRNAVACRRSCGNAGAPTAWRRHRHSRPSGSGHHTVRTLFIGLEKLARALRDASSLKQR